MERRWLVLVAVLAALLLLAPAAASAAPITSVFAGQTISGNPVPCTTQADGIRVCHGADNGGGSADLRLKTFDTVPLEVYVILPPAPPSGTDGNYPFIVQSHGWGGKAGGPDDTQYFGPSARTLAQKGYAVLQLTARGFGDSCGKATTATALGPCLPNGYIRLDDDRYEVRDIQHATGLLVDESVVDPARVGLTGESYGGGVSLQLATLKDRVMNPDGSLSPWKSPAGTALHIAAAAPVIPWSDLVYSLMPNGRTLDYRVTGPRDDLQPVGVMKQSFVSGLYGLGGASGFYSPPGVNPEADLTTWYARISAGEPYTDPQSQFLVDEIARYHSAYYLLNGAYGVPPEAPPPLFIANGFTDDLFPVDEAVRYYNLVRRRYPRNPIGLFAWDGGHQRGQNKAEDNALLSGRIQGFFDHYVKGSAAQTTLGATALTQTCGGPSEGPYSASTWAELHPRVLGYGSPPAQTISSLGGNPTTDAAVDPIGGRGACATVQSADQGPGVATYRLPPAPGPAGYTVLGAPVVTADLSVTGQHAFIAARLWDVNPATNTQTLVARGLYRTEPSSPDGRQVFQLHPAGWRFGPGHIPKLELLGKDSPYARNSNGQFSIVVTDLRLALPLH
jgi:dienelactone hydrolase